MCSLSSIVFLTLVSFEDSITSSSNIHLLLFSDQFYQAPAELLQHYSAFFCEFLYKSIDLHVPCISLYSLLVVIHHWEFLPFLILVSEWLLSGYLPGLTGIDPRLSVSNEKFFYSRAVFSGDILLGLCLYFAVIIDFRLDYYDQWKNMSITCVWPLPTTWDWIHL